MSSIQSVFVEIVQEFTPTVATALYENMSKIDRLYRYRDSHYKNKTILRP